MKQLIFPRPMNCTHIYSDGRQERVRYGQYETIQIISENGWPTNRQLGGVTLVGSYYFVSEVIKEDGTKVVFDEPWYIIEKQDYGDNSGRLAKSVEDPDRRSEQRQFIEHLEQASRTVQSWPMWKQTILGSIGKQAICQPQSSQSGSSTDQTATSLT